MGKRKTRRRSSRSRKKGGNPLLSLLGINSLCVWYGEGNTGGIDNKIKKGKMFGNFCGPCCKNGIGEFQSSTNEFYAVATTAKDVFMKDEETALFTNNDKVPAILNNFEVYNGEQIGIYNVYAIRYQPQCKYKGKRYELLKISGCNIEGTLLSENGVTVTPSGASVLEFKKNPEGKMDVTFKGQTIEGVEVNSFLLEKKGRRKTIGGKLRSRRRRRTKKKSKKKRKRTKKRRRRRR